MPTFIDESGDVGPHNGCARYFRLAGVWFETGERIVQYQERIKALKGSMGLSTSFEFHFTRINHQRRKAFFQALDGISFNFAVCAIEKHTYPDGFLKKEWIRETAIDGLACLMEETYRIAEGMKLGDAGLNEPIKFDQCDDPSYERSLKERFRALKSGRGDKKLIGDVRPIKSKSDLCVQLADMVCGAMGRHIEGDDTYYGVLGPEKMIGLNIRDAQRERAISR